MVIATGVWNMKLCYKILNERNIGVFSYEKKKFCNQPFFKYLSNKYIEKDHFQVNITAQVNIDAFYENWFTKQYSTE